MSNLNLNGTGFAVPSINTDKGCILWSLLRKGNQTVEELQASTGIRGVSPRVHDLNKQANLVLSIPEVKVRTQGSVTKHVDIVRYTVNTNLIDVSQQTWQNFLALGDSLYK